MSDPFPYWSHTLRNASKSADAPYRGRIWCIISEIEFLGSVLKDMAEWTEVGGRENLGSRILEFLRKRVPELIDKKNSVQDLDEFISDVHPKVESFKQQSRESGHPTSPGAVRKLMENVLESLMDVPKIKSLNSSAKVRMETINEKLRFLCSFLDFCLKFCPWKSEAFAVFLLDVAENAFHFSYVFWNSKMLETLDGFDIKISHMLLKMKPNNAEAIDMYVQILISAEQWGANYTVRDQAVSFANFVLKKSFIYKIDPKAEINEQLIFLIDILSHTPSDSEFTQYWESIVVDIRAVLLEAGSLDYSTNTNEMTEDVLSEMTLRFPRLQEMMKFIKVEIVLTRMEGKLVAPLIEKVPVLHEDIKFFKEFFYNPPEIEEDGTLFFTHIRILSDEATSFIYSIGYDVMTEETAMKMSLAVSVLQEKTKLIKAEVILNKMKNHKEEDLRVPRKDHIEAFQQGLSFLRKIFMDKPDIEENTEEGEMFWADCKVVSSESSSLVHFLNKERMVTKLDLLLVKLLQKINYIKAQVFLDWLRNSESLLSFQLKDQLKTLDEGLKFLRSFIMEKPNEDKEYGKPILEQSEAVTNEAAFFVCSLYEKAMNHEMAGEMTQLVQELVEKIKIVKSEIRKIYLKPMKLSLLNVPKTDDLGFVNLLMENLRALLKCNIYSISSVKPCIKTILEVMEFLKSFLNNIARQRSEFGELQDIWIRIIVASYQVEKVIDSFLVRGKPLWYRVLWLADVVEVMKVIREEVREIYSKNYYAIGVQRMVNIDAKQIPIPASTPVIDVVLVGIEDEAYKIIDRLIGGTEQLDVVPIIGMAGLGKTTLAKKVYNDASVAYHFHVRAWCCISQVYDKRAVLVDILGAIIELTDEIQRMSDEDIAAKLCKHLRGKRYFIVVDDLWKLEAWEDLRWSFPDDGNRSRILITSRLREVALQAKPDCRPHSLRLLSNDECWELLQMKLFKNTDSCPKELVEFGRQIARNCKGLPLAVVVISGLLLKTEKDLDWWKRIADSSTSHIVRDPQRKCMNMLELSYIHLPDNLKTCFLYFGAFPEDKEIPVRKLQWLWSAEGLSVKTDAKSSQEVAEHCLLDLIDRSLVFVAKRRSTGGVKSCHVHDLLRDFCLEKAREENFLQRVDGYGELFVSSCPTEMDCPIEKPVIYEQRRLCIYSERKHFTSLKPHGPHVRSLLFFPFGEKNPRSACDISFVCENFKLLRVLDLGSINMGNSFPSGIELMVQLRYLSVRGNINSIPSSIGNLWNLEALLVKGLRGEVTIPNSFWSMRSLRHVHINDRAGFCLLEQKLDDSFILEDMETFSSPALDSNNAKTLLRRLPKLQKLGCIFLESWDDLNMFPALDFLTRLESLKISYHSRISHPYVFKFPENLKKLTLSKFRLQWNGISTIGRLPNLEVLKLLFRAFEGTRWDMREGEFLKLKFLKLEGLDIVKWNASEDPFPCLQQLVLHKCQKLEEIPSSFGHIPTLQTIEVRWCSSPAVDSVMRILKDQEDDGNIDLRVFIYPSELVHRSFS